VVGGSVDFESLLRMRLVACESRSQRMSSLLGDGDCGESWGSLKTKTTSVEMTAIYNRDSGNIETQKGFQMPYL
jgi:hypothetical protein